MPLFLFRSSLFSWGSFFGRCFFSHGLFSGYGLLDYGLNRGFRLRSSGFGDASSCLGSAGGLSLLAGNFIFVQHTLFAGLVELTLNFVEGLYGSLLVFGA